jgi:hypothetical protein
MKSWIYTSIVLAALAGPAAGQDSHYWTTQFGNRARLLGGAVVGSASDSSAVYYNPGALALIAEPELLLSGTVFQYERVRVADALGPGRDLSKGRWFMAPSLVAGELRLKALGENRVAYAFLTRYDSEFRVTKRADVTDVLEASIPGIRFASQGISYESRLREYWIGGSWSRKIGERVAVGASPFIAVRNHRGRGQALTQALGSGGEGGIAIASRDFDYQHWRLLTKAGIAAGWERWGLGLTVTTPSLGLFGNGWTGIDRSAVGQDADEDGNELTQIATDFQEDLKPDYQSPFSFAFGGARRFGRSRVHFSTEWFDNVAPTTLLDPEPFQSQSSGETISYDTRYALDSIWNAALGFEHRFENGLQLYTAFSTDFSAAEESFRAQSAAASTANWDIYHLSGGFTFGVAGQEVTLGASYSFGSKEVGENDLGLDPDLSVSYRHLNFVFGAGLVF